MKLTFCLSIFLLLFASCSQQVPPPLTDAEKTAIQSEIRQAVNTMVRGAENLNADSALVIFLNSPEFFSIGVDGASADYKTFHSTNKDFFGSCIQLKFNSIQDGFRFLANDLVAYSWIYSAKAESKTGEQYSYENVGATFLFKKLQDRWITIYFHESSAPPAITGSKK